MKIRRAILLAPLLAVLGCASRTVDGIEEESPGLLARAAVSPDSARALIRSAYPGATIEKAEIEEEDGRLIYSFDLERDEEEVEVHVDAMTGAIEREEEGG